MSIHDILVVVWLVVWLGGALFFFAPRYAAREYESMRCMCYRTCECRDNAVASGVIWSITWPAELPFSAYYNYVGRRVDRTPKARKQRIEQLEKEMRDNATTDL